MTAGLASPFGKLRGKAIAFLGVLAIAIQCLVVQTHVHTGIDPAASAQFVTVADAGSTSDTQSPASPHRHGGSGLCYICQSAVAGTAILAATPSLNFVEVSFAAERIVEAPGAPPTSAPSHIWRSRAPPVQL